MDRNVWKQCGRKNRYKDEHTANYYKRLFERERGKKLDYYWCPYCNGFHLTSAELNLKYCGYDEADSAIVAG